MAKFNTFSAQTFTLGSSIGSSDNSILLSSFIEPVTNVPYTMALINSDIVFATIAPKTTSSELISFTGITQNVNGSALLTGVTRGLAKKYPYTTDAAYKLPHSGGSQFIISDAPQVFDQYLTDAQIDTDPTLAADSNSLIASQKATKAYVDNAVIGTIGTASETVYGTVKTSVAPAVAGQPVVVGTNDTRFTTESGTAINATTNKIIDEASVGLTGNDKVLRLTAGGKVTTSTIDTGVTDGQIIMVTTGNKLPAIDGSNLTNSPNSGKVYTDVKTAGTSVSNATTAVYTQTINANTFGANSRMSIFLSGHVTGNNSGNGPGVITITFGGATIYTYTFTPSNAGNNFEVKTEVLFGATNGTSDISGIIFIMNDSSTNTSLKQYFDRAKATASLTSNQTFTITFSNATGSETIVYYSSSMQVN